MEQLNVDGCYLCFIPTALQWRSGRSKHGWDAERKEAIRTYFSVALDSNLYTLNMRAIQGHSGGNQVDLSLQGNMEIPYDWTDYIHHAGPSHDCNSIKRSGRIAGGNVSKEGPHTASGSHERTTRRRTLRRDNTTKGTIQHLVENVPECSVLSQPEKCSKRHSNAIILDSSVPADCSWKSGTYQNSRNPICKGSFVTTSATKNEPHKCLASSTRGWYGETCCSREDVRTKDRFQNSRNTTREKLNKTKKKVRNNTLEDLWVQSWIMKLNMLRKPNCKANIRVRCSARNQNDLFTLKERSKASNCAKISPKFTIKKGANRGARRGPSKANEHTTMHKNAWQWRTRKDSNQSFIAFRRVKSVETRRRNIG